MNNQKDLIWVGNSLDDLRKFSRQAMRQTGFELRAVQKGLNPSDWKPMRTIGPGVREIRIHAENEYRTIYVATFTDAVYVLHCFAKKSRNTPRSDIEIAKQRLKEARHLRRKAR